MISVIATLIIMSSLFSKFIIIGHTSLVYSVISITILSLVSFVLTFLTAKIQKRNERILPQLFEKLTDVNRKAMYLASNIVYNYSIGKDIRIYNVSGLINKEMEEASEKFAPYLKRISKVSNIPSVLGNASSAIIGGIIFIIVGLYAKLGYFEIGDVYLYAGTIQQFIGSVTSMVFAIGELNVINSRLTQSYKLLNMPDGYIHNENITVDEFQNIPSEFEIIFDDVSFHYPDSKNWALKNISFKISTTERIAIVGTNGAGKTTVIKLLCRLYTPTEGRILINNIDINTIPMEQYMRIISVVFQDFKLFSFSIGQNLSLSESYDINKALEVLKDSGFYDRLQNLSNGTDSFIYNDYAEDGIEISGGEAQKIAIARLLYANSPIVILDEPTAALDPKAEAEIFEKFNDIITNKTAIYISHRLSSCKFSDRIFVFDKGELVQHGKHEQLVLQDGGLYKTLWESQSKYYKDHTQLINM